MKKQLPLIITFLYTILSACCIAQTNTQQITPKHNEKSNNYPYSVFFQNAYRQYSDIPVGMLEAVSYTMTHLHHVDSTTSESCTGIPRVYGVMGLTLNGKGYFRNNLLLISQLSGFTVNDIINNPEVNILAYAAAYSSLMKQAGTKTEDIEKQVNILKALSEIPNNLTNEFALNSYIYSVLSFLNGSNNQQVYNFSNHEIDISNIFGVENYRLLSSPTVVIKKNERRSDLDTLTSSAPPLDILSSDYGPAIWNPAASCNYTVGRTASISAVAIHDTEGSYSGTISWFQNCSSVLSSHYVIRSSDGQVTQMVLEANRAYHVGSENAYTIGIEHEGYCSQPGWYTNAMYCSSANLVKDICNSGYGISPTSAYSGIACNCSSMGSLASVCASGNRSYIRTSGCLFSFL